MDLTGARWSLEGAEAVLRLRSLRASGDFEDYMVFLHILAQPEHSFWINLNTYSELT